VIQCTIWAEKYMNTSGILVHNISDCLQVTAANSVIELARRKHYIRDRHGIKKKFVQTYGNSSAFARQ